MLQVSSLTKCYGATTAVRDLSFGVRGGEILGLLGPNGAGKTTTLRCLAGILRPSEGSIVVAGHDLLAEPVPAKRELAFIPDEPHFFPYLTVEEHLRFVGRLYGVADLPEREGPLLEELELTEKRTALPAELSRGMQQKLALACGLVHSPGLIILDEPLTGLDPAAIRRTKRMIVRQAEAGTAIILSSHLLSLVEELCTHLLVMHRGERVAFGTAEEIVTERPQLAGRGLEDLFMALTGQQEMEPEVGPE
jgi:ABC-2 type transport system ATP-binding protein